MGGYAIMSANNQVTMQTGISWTPTKLVNVGVNYDYVGTTVVPTDDKIIIKIQGSYLINVQVSFQKDVDDTQDNYHIFLYRNGVSTGYGGSRNLKVNTPDLGSVAFHGILDLNVNDVLELYIHTDAAGPYSVTVVDAQFSIVGI